VCPSVSAADASDTDNGTVVGTVPGDDDVPIDTELSEYIDIEGGRVTDYSITAGADAELLTDTSLHAGDLPRVSSAVSRSVFSSSRSVFTVAFSRHVSLGSVENFFNFFISSNSATF